MKTFPKPMLPAEALQALERGDYAGAIRLLEAEPSRLPESGVPAALGPALGDDAYELLALAYFKAEQYESAALHYAAALERQPHRTDLRDMLALAQANATAAVHVHVPDVHYFDRASLLAAPTMPWNALPPPLPPLPRPGLGGRVRIALGNVLGVVATASVNGITHAWGRFAGYRDAVWTNWYRRGTTLGVVTLAYMRELLNAHNLVTTYPPRSAYRLSEQGPDAAAGRHAFPHGGRHLERSGRSQAGRGQHALSAQRRYRRGPARNGHATAHAESARDQPHASHPQRTDEGSPVSQSAGGGVDPVHEP